MTEPKKPINFFKIQLSFQRPGIATGLRYGNKEEPATIDVRLRIVDARRDPSPGSRSRISAMRRRWEGCWSGLASLSRRRCAGQGAVTKPSRGIASGTRVLPEDRVPGDDLVFQAKPLQEHRRIGNLQTLSARDPWRAGLRVRELSASRRKMPEAHARPCRRRPWLPASSCPNPSQLRWCGWCYGIASGGGRETGSSWGRKARSSVWFPVRLLNLAWGFFCQVAFVDAGGQRPSPPDYKMSISRSTFFLTA